MANAYLRMKGQKSGDIQGSVTQRGHENSIFVFAVEHSIETPRDPATGLPTGKRMHKPLVISKQIDKSSPRLYTMLVSNEAITTWELQFWRWPSAQSPARPPRPEQQYYSARSGPSSEEVIPAPPLGPGQQYYTVKLTNAKIASITFHSPNTQDPNLMKFSEYEEVAFTYQQIEWIWTEGRITAQDSWEVAVR